jgi:hypothetical protein
MGLISGHLPSSASPQDTCLRILLRACLDNSPKAIGMDDHSRMLVDSEPTDVVQRMRHYITVVLQLGSWGFQSRLPDLDCMICWRGFWKRQMTR